jgi:hypothetical protein
MHEPTTCTLSTYTYLLLSWVRAGIVEITEGVSSSLRETSRRVWGLTTASIYRAAEMCTLDVSDLSHWGGGLFE